MRVVITGMGLVTCLGHTVDHTWQAVVAGQTGIRAVAELVTGGLPSHMAGTVVGFDPTDYIDRKMARRMDRVTQLALVATQEALRQAHLTIDSTIATETGVLVGSAVGHMTTLVDQFAVLHERGPARISPFYMPMTLANMAAGQIALALGAQGPSFGLVSACATGVHAIGEATEIIRRGDAQIMIAGGSEACVTPIVVGAFANMGALSTRNDDPARASRPFDATRDGFVLAEGAGIVVLESEESALARGALPLALVAGYGATSDAYHVVEPPPDGNGVVRAARRALARAGLEPSAIGYVNAHGTSTPANDRVETQALKTIFGPLAHTVPISSTKGALGHALGATGAIETILSVLSLRSGILPPTLHYSTPDPACDLDYIPNAMRQISPYGAALSLSMGFGGQNAAIIVAQPRTPRL